MASYIYILYNIIYVTFHSFALVSCFLTTSHYEEYLCAKVRKLINIVLIHTQHYEKLAYLASVFFTPSNFFT